MKILTWNIYKNNKKVDKVIKFLKNGEFDVMCLQEFPAHSIDKLKSLKINFISEDEFFINKSNKKSAIIHTVIISKIPIVKYGVVKHKKIYKDITTRDNRYSNFKADSFYADIEKDGRQIRIFNAHFKCVASPYHRLSQFNEILENFDNKKENIICGDLNTFGHPAINMFVWKHFGYSFKELLIDEREVLNTTLHLNKLKNPFRGMITFLKFPIQLDYILLPINTNILYKKRFLRSYGSDHLPISVKI